MMDTMSLDDIHINELVKKAGVSRMSYYRYFTNKTDVLKFYLEYILDDYFNNIDGKDGSSFQSYEHILGALEFFYSYRDFILCLHNAKMSGMVLDALNRYIEKQSTLVHTEDTLPYPLYYYSGAIFNVYMQWILHGAKETPQKVARIISDIYNNNSSV